jgi:CPA2 family monovalent cation:H+ antiporter-2
VQPTVIELNMETVRELKDESIHAIYGDASHRDTLKAAGVAAAAVLVLTSADIAHTEEVIRSARDLNPQVRVLARTTHLREVTALSDAGADDIFSGEGEVALAFTVAILSRLGATAEQIDRERGRVHDELFAGRRA